MRRFLCLLLLVCLPLQSFAVQLSGVQETGLAQLFHQVDHAEAPHHHDDDGSIHYDNSDESSEHSGECSASHQQSLLTSGAVLFNQLVVSAARRFDPLSFIPHPYLDDPQRPPARAPGFTAGG